MARLGGRLLIKKCQEVRLQQFGLRFAVNVFDDCCTCVVKEVEKQIAKHASGPGSMAGRVSGSMPISLQRSLSLACHSALSTEQSPGDIARKWLWITLECIWI